MSYIIFVAIMIKFPQLAMFLSHLHTSDTFSLADLDPNALRRSGTYDAVPPPRTRPESFVSDP